MKILRRSVALTLVPLVFLVLQATCGMESPFPKVNIVRRDPQPSDKPLTQQKPTIFLQAPLIAVPMEAEHAVIRNIIEKKFPYFNHLFIVDEIKKDAGARFLYENEKTFIFTKLADHLHSKGSQFINEWIKNYPDFNKIREICKNCREIYGRDGKDILYFNQTVFHSEMHRVSMIDFVSDTFFDPCLYYYNVAKLYSQRYTPVYDKHIESIENSIALIRESLANPQNIPSSAPT